MQSSVPDSPVHILELTATRNKTNPQLPSKRKREPLGGLESNSTLFTIKPYPNSADSKPVTLRPVCVISRSQLPLSFLNTTFDEQYPPNGLFTARIDVLEGDRRHGDQEGFISKVLIAQQGAAGLLYAIEAVQARVYSICKLVSWLQEKEVAQLWDPYSALAYPAPSIGNNGHTVGGLWWQHAAVEVQPAKPSAKRARTSMLRPTVQTVRIKPEPHHDVVHEMPHTMELGSAFPPESFIDAVAEAPTAQEQLEALVQHYLDAVYISKTSLAYLAKGPVTRIRNAFTSPNEGAPPTYELADFLRSMLLSPKASEKKYYDTLPSVIKSLPAGMVSDEEATAKPNKAKKSKKNLKINRDGIYPAEDALVKKWWRSEMPSADNAGQETIESRIRRRVGDLRVRETLAQLILMLEIIALESLATYRRPTEERSSLTGETQAQGNTQVQPKKRKKKLDDIALQLDLLLDKLSIWHATEEAGIIDFDLKASKQQDNGAGNGKDGHDRLHSFCVEVIVPFYMSRLPEQALNVNKKLGGPAIASSKRKAMRPPLTSKKSSESKEPEAKRSRRSLARVATDNTGRTGDKRTPSLVRSATDTALLRQQSIRRETSEAPLAAIPFKRSPSRARQSMSQLRHLQGREMDLTATSAAAAAKLKHKARVEDDLKEAIATLKKPNRDLAAGAYMAEIEKRGSGPAKRSRKPANPVRKVVKDVQVTATPRASRMMKNVIEQTPVHYHQNPFTRPPSDEADHMSDLCIPSSGIRQMTTLVTGTTQRSVTAREIWQPGVAETPSKSPTTQLFTSGSARRTIFATPVKSSTRLFPQDPHTASSIFETPIKAAGSPPFTTRAATPPVIADTPVKVTAAHVDTAPVVFATPAKQSQDERSIYDALGWNDDDDDDLA